MCALRARLDSTRARQEQTRASTVQLVLIPRLGQSAIRCTRLAPTALQVSNKTLVGVRAAKTAWLAILAARQAVNHAPIVQREHSKLVLLGLPATLVMSARHQRQVQLHAPIAVLEDMTMTPIPRPPAEAVPTENTPLLGAIQTPTLVSLVA